MEWDGCKVSEPSNFALYRRAIRDKTSQAVRPGSASLKTSGIPEDSNGHDERQIE